MDEQTFSVEVLAFASGTDDEHLVSSLRDAFGIENDAAKTLIHQAPVRVKRGADPEGTKHLVAQLLALRADVRITNEQTGEERTYQAATLEGATSSRPPPAIPVEDPERSASGSPIPHGAQPFRAEGGTSLLEALALAREKQAARAGMLPDELRPTPNPLQISSPALTPYKSGTSQPPPPTEGPVLETCAVCNRKAARGDVCNHCGWSNSLKKRLSPSGKEPAPEAKLNAVATVGLAAAGLAGAAAAFWFVGIFEAFVAPALAMAVGLALYATSIELRSGTWSVPAAYLKRDETKSIKRAKIKWFAFAVSFVVIGAAMLVPGQVEETSEVRIDSFGIGWAADVPGRSPEPKRRVLAMDAFGDRVQATGMSGHPERGEPRTVMMFRVPLGMTGHESASPEGIDQTVKTLLDKTFTDVEVSEADDASFDKARMGRAGSFEAADETGAVSGGWRAFLYDHELLIVLYAGEPGESEPTGQAFMDSLHTVAPGAP